MNDLRELAVDELERGSQNLVSRDTLSEGLGKCMKVEIASTLPHQRHVERRVAGVQLIERPEAKLSLCGRHGVGRRIGLTGQSLKLTGDQGFNCRILQHVNSIAGHR